MMQSNFDIDKAEMYHELIREIFNRHHGQVETMSSEECRIMKEAIIFYKEGLEKSLEEIMPLYEQWKGFDCGDQELDCGNIHLN